MTKPDSLLSGIAALANTNRQELVAACLERAKITSSVFTSLYPESALAAAILADTQRASGIEQSPIAGLPVSIKDLLDVAGETTLAGSVVLREHAKVTRDAPVVARLRSAGAAIIGKTNMTEFAFSGVGLNPHYGTPANPCDSNVARIPGGSSSGAAVSVAAGMCVAGIGSDTGGSIRIPAALCGLVGYKPTMRRVPVSGTIPLSSSLDTICAMTRSVEDCLLVDSIIADSPLQAAVLPLSGMRLVVPQEVVLDGMDKHVAASFDAALKALSLAGAEIIVLPMQLLHEARQINLFAPIEAYAWHADLLHRSGHLYDQRVAARMKLGANYSTEDYARLQIERRSWVVRMEAELQGFDAMLMPTVPLVAPAIAELEQSDETYFEINRLMLRNPSLINLLDGCAITLPCHAQGSLPVGLSVAGAAMSDSHINSVARAIAARL
jgi:Asp-tRNA(Asn)/Glu-tRNA(Gln) amidotransferase A subunit family amidase